MPRLIKTPRCNIVYQAPPGAQTIVDMPCEKRAIHGGGTGIFSTWQFSPAERAAIAAGANIEVGILYLEPIPPICIEISSARPLTAMPKPRPTTNVAPTPPLPLAPQECVYRHCPSRDICETKGCQHNDADKAS